jgi:tRNA (guanine37-N1)-methyltransferase
MKFTVLSLFPEILQGFFSTSIMARAVERALVGYSLVNIRDFALDKHRKCDDEVYGGGPGMLMLPGPLGGALDSVSALDPGKRVLCLSPSGKLFDQAMAREFSREEELILICGRYEGVDQRIIDKYVDDEVSVGDYVLSSGEVAALVIVDSVYRLVEGVISGESLEEESFSGGLLEYPQYTRPEVYDSLRVPEVLLSGHHANIERWRLRMRVEKTLRNRPELLEGPGLTEELDALARELRSQGDGNGHAETGGRRTD